MILVAAPANDICEAGWLDWFNAELSLKRYWRGPRSQEVGGSGGGGGGGEGDFN